MRARGTLLGAALMVLMVAAAGAQSGYDLFQQALVKERAEENLTEAIRIYERIVRDFASNRSLVARTLVQLGAAYEKRQDLTLARAAYDRVNREFATEAEAVAEARRRLAALDGAPVQGGLTLRVAATGDDAYSGAWITPDGRFMARPHWETGDLAVRDLVLGTTTRMLAKAGTYDAGEDREAEVDEAMLSPDQKWIAYLWHAPPDHRMQVRVMPNQVGGRPRVLVDSDEYNPYIFAGWSPDGKSILAVFERPDRTWVLAWITIDGTPAVRPVRSLGWRWVPGRLSISPDGRYVAYAALPSDPGTRINYRLEPPSQQHIYVLPLDGSGAETAVVRGASINGSPVWTPDGRRILFVSDRSGTGFGLWSVGVQNGSVSESPSSVDISLAGRIRPVGVTDQGALYFTPEPTDGPRADVFVARIDAGTQKVASPLVRLLDNFPDRNLAATWSPDGEKVAFVRRRPGSANPGIDRDALALVVYDRDSETEKEFPIPYLNSVVPPQWFRDGRSVLIHQRYDGGKLYRVDIESGARRSVEAVAHASLPENVTSAVLAPDEKTVYLGVGAGGSAVGATRWEIVAFELETGERRVVWTPDGGASIVGFALSPDGRRLAVEVRRPEWASPRLLGVGVEGGRAVELAPSVRGGTVAWTTNGIYFSSDEEQPRLMRIPPAGGDPAPAGIPGSNLPVSVGPDGTSVLLTQMTRDEARLYVIDNLTSLWTPAAQN